MVTRCLVIGNCTGQKDDAGCPEGYKLTRNDFEVSERRLLAEQKVRPWHKAASQMYTGRQHVLMMQGVQRLRKQFPEATFDVAIVSAGYGVIDEKRKVAPYEVTFNGMSTSELKAWSNVLKIPAMTKALVLKYDVVFFLLGTKYLMSLGALPQPMNAQKFIYFGESVRRMTSAHPNVVIIPAAQKQANLYGGAGVTGIKGSMFNLLSKGLTKRPPLWNKLLEDSTAATLHSLITSGKSC